MKKILTLLTLAVLATFALPASAQEKKMFTPADASYNNRSLYAQRPSQLKWIGDTDILMKVKDKEIVTMNPNSTKETTFLTLDELNAYTKGEGVNDLMRIPQLTWLNDFQAYFFGLGDNALPTFSDRPARATAPPTISRLPLLLSLLLTVMMSMEVWSSTRADMASKIMRCFWS